MSSSLENEHLALDALQHGTSTLRSPISTSRPLEQTTPETSRLARTLAGIALLVLAAGSGAGVAAAEPSGQAKKPPPAVSVETIAPRQFVERLALTGSIEPTIVAELSSPAEGPVYDCRVREGDRVTAGDTLLGIGRETSVTANVAAAEEELQRKQRDFDRFSSLATRNVLAADELDRARAELERARAGLTQAQQAASDYVLKAPWPGIVARVHVADGKYVAPRTPLVDLFDPSSLVLRFQVPERHVFAIEQGDAIEARFDAFPDRPFTLAITRAFPEIDRRLRTRTFEAALPLDQVDFAPGQFARIAVALQTVPQAITIPVEAMATGTDGQPVVFVVAADGTARAVPITPGTEQDGRMLVADGLAPGDRLIVNGIEKVRAGEPVRVADAPPASAATPTEASPPASPPESSPASSKAPAEAARP
jgi:membrane fusion protein (multidrug efflux system)